MCIYLHADEYEKQESWVKPLREFEYLSVYDIDLSTILLISLSHYPVYQPKFPICKGVFHILVSYIKWYEEALKAFCIQNKVSMISSITIVVYGCYC